MNDHPNIFAALPAMNESENLPGFLDSIRRQIYPAKKLVVCVNQPDEWWYRPDKLEICIDNQKSIDILSSAGDVELELIDKSSKGSGWTGKKYGVGLARKKIMDSISNQADKNDIIISLDADTAINPGYFQSIVESFSSHPDAVAFAVPYYHHLTDDWVKNRAILRYEMYMRYYAINLWRIENPYSFTAIGSAIALPVWAYRSIGGMTPHKSGEDFYFLQKLRKFGKVYTRNREKVYPAARYSDRVGFGTGPAMIKGSRGDWSSYPIYPYGYFDMVKETYDLFETLFEKNVDTPMDEFNKDKFGDENIWQALRENYKSRENFVKACGHKIDAFRIIQFLKWKHKNSVHSDEKNLIEFMHHFYPEKWQEMAMDLSELSFEKSPVEELDNLRNTLVQIEENYQRNNEI